MTKTYFEQGKALKANGRWAVFAIGLVCTVASIFSFGIPLLIAIPCWLAFFAKAYTEIRDVEKGEFAWAYGWGSPAMGSSYFFKDYQSAVLRTVKIVTHMRQRGPMGETMVGRRDEEKVTGLFIYKGRDRLLLYEASPDECKDFYKKYIKQHGLKLYNGAPIPRQEMLV